MNVIIGPNGSGKSNLLRLLKLVSASAQRRLGKWVRSEGGMPSILWDGRADRIILTTSHSWVEPRRLHYRLELLSRNVGDDGINDFVVTEETAECSTSSAGISPFRISLLRQNDRAKVIRSAEPKLLDFEDLPLNETFLGMVPGVPELRASPIGSLQYALESWCIVDELRTDHAAVLRQAPVASYEKQLDADGQNLVNLLHTLYSESRDFKSDVDDAMRAAFGADFDELLFPPASDRHIQMRIRWKSLNRPTPAADLSDGTLRFLFLMALLAHPSPPALIAIDEPETGLHPGMFPIIAEYAMEASKRTQILFTTHSPEFLNAFPKEHVPTVTVATWENGETKLTVKTGDDLREWLKEFTLGDLHRGGALEAMT